MDALPALCRLGAEKGRLYHHMTGQATELLRDPVLGSTSNSNDCYQYCCSETLRAQESR